MEDQKILNLLNNANDSKFVIRKWNIVNGNSKANYGVGGEIIYNTEISKSSPYDYNDAYILVRGDITIENCNLATEIAFKNCALFTKCITEIRRATIDDPGDLNLLMPMYNLIEYNSNYSEATGSLWFLSKEEATNFNEVIANDNNFNL